MSSQMLQFSDPSSLRSKFVQMSKLLETKNSCLVLAINCVSPFIVVTNWKSSVYVPVMCEMDIYAR
jgi:hypothetical protein